jgi:histidinol-phosphate/aromatic aminotransferase/cobyric acid decarboxylase-like protein
MSLLLRMQADTGAQAALAAEHAHWRTVLATRADALDAALRAEGLDGATWDAGFFVTLPAHDAPALAERLTHEGVYVVPMHGGIRVGVCGVRAADAPRFAAALRASRAG